MKPLLRFQAALVVVSAILVSCGGGSPSPTAEAAGTSAPSSSDAPTTTASQAADELPIAPDFTLTLEPEGEFTLSEAGKPVYMIFWAEW